MPEKWVLDQLRALPLSVKVKKTQIRIKEWYEHFDGNVYVSFSGGKDSTVLACLVREIYPDVPLVFSNTGLEYPEIQEFARKKGAEFIRPAMRFDEVISKYGYPIVSKEVSGAIYYARRIKNTGLESIRRRGDLLTEQKQFTCSKRMQILGKVSELKQDNEDSGKVIGNKRNELQGNRKDRKTEDGGRAESIFNKRKWLPLCDETQYMISDKCCSKMKKNAAENIRKENETCADTWDTYGRIKIAGAVLVQKRLQRL